MRYFLAFLFLISFNLILIGQQTVGIFQNTPEASNGYTLFGNNKSIYLIDQCGFVVNNWESFYDPGLTTYLLKNGNLLRTTKIDGFFSSNTSGRFELFNWEGDLIWNYEFYEENFQAHHDIEPLPNGNFLAIIWEKIPEEEAQQNGRRYDGAVWSEKVIELEIIENNQANIVWEWRLWDHLIQDYDSTKLNYGDVSLHPELMDLNYIGTDEATEGDWIHLNAIHYNAELDQIALSSRHISEIWIIDHSTTTEEARTAQGGNSNRGGNILYRYGNPQVYKRGSIEDQVFSKQHDIRWVSAGYPRAGSLMVFNNFEEDSISSIKVWTPPLNSDGTYNIVNELAYGPTSFDWEYSDLDFFSKNISGAHFLANGNLFITEGRTGRFFEITPEKEKVWEYINPSNRFGPPIIQGESARFNDVFRAKKYHPDYEGFSGKDLSSGLPIERNPWDLACDTSQSIIPPIMDLEIKSLLNPVFSTISFDANFIDQNIEAILTDLNGREILKRQINLGPNEIPIPDLAQGIYLLRFSNFRTNISTHKIVKL